MTTNATVRQAIELLNSRRRELLDELGELDSALAALNGGPARKDTERAPIRSSRSSTAARSTSIRTAVLATLESEDKRFSISEIFDRIAPSTQGDRDDDSLRARIRGALFALRNEGRVVSEDGEQRAAKWLTSADTTSPANPNSSTEAEPFELTSPPLAPVAGVG